VPPLERGNRAGPRAKRAADPGRLSSDTGHPPRLGPHYPTTADLMEK
jgi:hypothetical protein